MIRSPQGPKNHARILRGEGGNGHPCFQGTFITPMQYLRGCVPTLRANHAHSVLLAIDARTVTRPHPPVRPLLRLTQDVSTTNARPEREDSSQGLDTAWHRRKGRRKATPIPARPLRKAFCKDAAATPRGIACTLASGSANGLAGDVPEAPG